MVIILVNLNCSESEIEDEFKKCGCVRLTMALTCRRNGEQD